jgi:transcriptional regulator with XRE-family HTH domain
MNVDFPEWLQAQMSERSWTQAELARRAGTTSTTVYRVINRERKPGVDFCQGVARAFGMRDFDVMKIAGIAASTSLDDQPPSVREMIGKFTRLSDEDQIYILKIVTALDETEQAQKRRAKKPVAKGAKS